VLGHFMKPSLPSAEHWQDAYRDCIVSEYSWYVAGAMCARGPNRLRHRVPNTRGPYRLGHRVPNTIGPYRLGYRVPNAGQPTIDHNHTHARAHACMELARAPTRGTVLRVCQAPALILSACSKHAARWHLSSTAPSPISHTKCDWLLCLSGHIALSCSTSIPPLFHLHNTTLLVGRCALTYLDFPLLRKRSGAWWGSCVSETPN